MNRNVLRMARRALGKPPAYVARRALQELQAEAERFFGPRRARTFGERQLLARTGAASVDALWQKLGSRPYAAEVAPIPRDFYDVLCPGDAERILGAAERALAHRVDLLGSGEVHLGEEIDWHKDYKSGFRWPPQYFRDIDYMNPGRPSDVKFPWEVSRFQWVIPCGQAWLLTRDERWAAGARRLLEDWIAGNPYGGSVNWSCTMEAALRVLSWTWLFHACSSSKAWADHAFRVQFLTSLYLHADFTDRHIEYADVNGNHCDADAAALVFAGLFFGGEGQPRRWLERGWKILCDELPRQVSADGVDYEGSVPYHRLVAELFFLPARYRMRQGLEVPASYIERVTRMGWFTEAYTRPDGSAPVWGDADDARALPFGGQDINDHRYLLGWIGESFGDAELARRFSGPAVECVWLLGADAASGLLARPKPTEPPRSVLFREGGYAVLRNARDHVFIDCGPVGMAGRGGHGHNDVLSFEAFLDGHHLVTDCGSYTYTADFAARNAFRSTAYHNTPRIDGEEINRFFGPQDLWWLRDDARTTNVQMSRSYGKDVLTARHSGFERLRDPVVVQRTFMLDGDSHELTIRDEFACAGRHDFEVAVHLTPGMHVEADERGCVLHCLGTRFRLSAESTLNWAASLETCRVSPSYGKARAGQRMSWRRGGEAEPLEVRLAPLP
jgi:uncharacterized heparinase superfamily protein